MNQQDMYGMLHLLSNNQSQLLDSNQNFKNNLITNFNKSAVAVLKNAFSLKLDADNKIKISSSIFSVEIETKESVVFDTHVPVIQHRFLTKEGDDDISLLIINVQNNGRVFIKESNDHLFYDTTELYGSVLLKIFSSLYESKIISAR